MLFAWLERAAGGSVGVAVTITDDTRTVQGNPEPGFDRIPPQDLAAEQCVLGAMMLSKDAIADVVEVLRSADFYRPAHATVFDAVLDLYGRGEPGWLGRRLARLPDAVARTAVRLVLGTGPARRRIVFDTIFGMREAVP